MSHCFRPEYRKARKGHICTCCGEKIHKGELYLTWANVDDHFFTNKAHFECNAKLDGEYDLYEIRRPAHRLTNHGLVLEFRKWGWPTAVAENYKRPILSIGFL